MLGVQSAIEIRGRFKWTSSGFDQPIRALSSREHFLTLVEEVPDHVGELEESEIVRERNKEDRGLLGDETWWYIEVFRDRGRR